MDIDDASGGPEHRSDDGHDRGNADGGGELHGRNDHGERHGVGAVGAEDVHDQHRLSGALDYDGHHPRRRAGDGVRGCDAFGSGRERSGGELPVDIDDASGGPEHRSDDGHDRGNADGGGELHGRNDHGERHGVGPVVPKTFTISITYPALSITTATIPGGAQGTAYAGVTLSAAGGSGVAGNYQWTSTTLPAGLSIGLTTGTIAGTPTAAGNYTGVTITVSDTVSGRVPKTFTISIAYPALSITTATIPGGAQGTAYAGVTLSAAGGSGVAGNYQGHRRRFRRA